MTNSIFGTGPNQVPLNAHLGRLAYADDLNVGMTTVVLTSTQAWTPPYPCVADIYVTGGGGTAAKRRDTFEGSTPGGTAGTAIKFGVQLSPAVSYTCAVGAAGAVADVGTTGNPGTASSFSGAGITTPIVGNGGFGGTLASVGMAINHPSLGVSGAWASGGDMNIRGEGGGVNFAATSTTVGTALSTSTVWGCLGQAAGASFWGPGTAAVDATNYGCGGSGTGDNFGGTVKAPKSGVIVIRYQYREP